MDFSLVKILYFTYTAYCYETNDKKTPKFLINYFKADLLNGLEEAFCRNLALAAHPVVYLKNQFVQRSGEIASCMCYVHHGILEVCIVCN